MTYKFFDKNVSGGGDDSDDDFVPFDDTFTQDYRDKLFKQKRQERLAAAALSKSQLKKKTKKLKSELSG